ncbi:DUF6088 family protein [Belliella sp. R4-6]|uniref:DUF6088 family protein n=1 Tax=Belliella alkalica TaxID=1730871 RepID=A0ABS9VBG7_9BACT|nr:DUF6088 family protein [Belliella alkalica]MCH7413787.1 DUF6088 family protein [Belliella alkalica]
MKVAEQIRKTIAKLPEDKTFGYADLRIGKEDNQTAAKALERMQAKGLIKKMSKGIFYKPIKTVFGELLPDESEQLKRYLFKNGKRIAYITGESLYNQMNLTTQMAFRIKIASNKRINIDKGAIKAKSVKSYAEVSEENYGLLGFLDALKDIKTIPDCPVSKAVMILSKKLELFQDRQIEDLIKYALLYPPRVRALLGAILENSSTQYNISKLKESLNPLTKIKLGLKETDLSSIRNWYIT